MIFKEKEPEELFKIFGVLWQPIKNSSGNEWIHHEPLCPNVSCHRSLDKNISNEWYCLKCDKSYKLPTNLGQIDAMSIKAEVEKLWEGHKTLNHKIYSLDLPPTKVVDEAEDENYWVQARISEKNGKRMAVIYFGERITGKQDKKDYVQVFLDLDDEQLRFDKTNKNPMKLLCKLTAEFPDSLIDLQHKK